MKSSRCSAVGLVLLAFLAGCATPDQKVEVYNTDSANTESMTERQANAADARVCTKEYVVGSRFPVTTCLTKEQAEQRKLAAKDDQDLLMRRQAIPPK